MRYLKFIGTLALVCCCLFAQMLILRVLLLLTGWQISETIVFVYYCLIAFFIFFVVSVKWTLDDKLADFAYYLIGLLAVVILVANAKPEREFVDVLARQERLKELLGRYGAQYFRVSVREEYTQNLLDALEARQKQFRMVDRGRFCRNFRELYNGSLESERVRELEVTEETEGGTVWLVSPCDAVEEFREKSYRRLEDLLLDWRDTAGRIAIEHMWPETHERLPAFRHFKSYAVKPDTSQKDFPSLLYQISSSIITDLEEEIEYQSELEGDIKLTRVKTSVFQTRIWAYVLVLMFGIKLARKSAFGLA